MELGKLLEHGRWGLGFRGGGGECRRWTVGDSQTVSGDRAWWLVRPCAVLGAPDSLLIHAVLVRPFVIGSYWQVEVAMHPSCQHTAAA